MILNGKSKKTQQKIMNKLLIYYLHFYFNSKDKPIKMQLETYTFLSFFLALVKPLLKQLKGMRLV
jgi:hypothetical protein